MKKLFLTLILTGINCVGFSQTNTPVLDQQSFLEKLSGAITNIGVATYATYAPDAPTKYGGGALVLYNFTPNVGAGFGLNWLGHFSTVSANFELSLPTHGLSFLGGYFTNIITTPFVMAALETPYGGAGENNGQVGTVAEAGLNIDFLETKGGWRFGGGYAYGNVTGAGNYDGSRHNLFLKIGHGF